MGSDCTGFSDSTANYIDSLTLSTTVEQFLSAESLRSLKFVWEVGFVTACFQRRFTLEVA